MRTMILVNWEEFDEYGDYLGETRTCMTWDEAVEYMKKEGKRQYSIEVVDDNRGDERIDNIT